MAEIELDGKKVSAPDGAMVIQAAFAAGVYIPHFCYHKKLSIAANCRMCLVDIEKMPKPMPACATPVANGMIVRTKSAKAVSAQKSVMEFLLINHPLDCPICDQGGECQLQDLSVGYGWGASRFPEEKRVVLRKDVSPIVGMEEMTRCIHCTRCIRFGIEVGGVMELGMINRGERSEITTVHGGTLDSELSGNVIDICPVGALTSKPFRYTARTWELARRRSVSPHDSVGANLVVQSKADKVLRVVPFDNEEVNECWIADRDRFSYEALNSERRLTRPMIKQGGQWQAVDWSTALEYVADGLRRVQAEFGPGAVHEIGALGHPTSSVEELHLLAKLVRGLGSESVDHRLRHADFDNRAPGGCARWLGTSIAALSQLDRAFVVGSFLRKDHPLLAQRLRQAVRAGAQLSSLHAVHDDWAMPLAHRLAVVPSRWVAALAEVAAAVAKAQGVEPPLAAASGAEAEAVAASLLGGERKAVLLGNAAAQHPEAGALLALANWIAQHTGASCGYLGESGNSVGAQLVDAVPGPGGLHAAQMLAQPMKALLLLNVEPVLDAADAAAAKKALAGAGLVVALSAFRDTAADVADVMLPVAPFTETGGAFVNAEGRLQSFQGVVKPLGETRPAWKVLRVLGNLLELPGFAHESVEDVRTEALGDAATLAARLSNASAVRPSATAALSALSAGSATRCERIADVPIYASDAMVRRAPSLQLTADARAPVVGVPAPLWAALHLSGKVLVSDGETTVVLPARLDPQLAEGAVRIAAGHPDTAMLGAMFGTVTLEKV